MGICTASEYYPPCRSLAPFHSVFVLHVTVAVRGTVVAGKSADDVCECESQVLDSGTGLCGECSGSRACPVTSAAHATVWYMSKVG